MAARMLADRKKAFNTAENPEDVEGQGGSSNALREAPYLPFSVAHRGPQPSSVLNTLRCDQPAHALPDDP
jgi:hypothetical protein